MKGKVVSIVGARPQFIKLGPMSKAMREFYDEKIIHSGQHYDQKMSDLLFRDLNIPKPDYYLNIKSGSHGLQTGKMLIKTEEVLLKEKPDLVITFGDTNTTLAGALTAAKLHIPTIHIEAGLRSYNNSMPEEINRIVADHTSDYLFVPTNNAMKILRSEGLQAKSVLTGDIMVDALHDNLKIALNKSEVEKLIDQDYYLLTLHRPYNVDFPEKLENILFNLGKVKKRILFPVHPRTNHIIVKNKIKVPSNIKKIEPLGYLDFIKLEYFSEKIITDSGGIQKEAYLLKKPCITLRSETEWTETIEDKWNILLNSDNKDYSSIIENFYPSSPQNEVFGKNVAQKMIEEINKIMNI